MNAIKRPTLLLSWVGAIVAAEILGRRSPSDLWDAIGVSVFATLVGLTIVRLENSESLVAVRLRESGRAFRRRAAGWWPEMGVDLRGSPPVERAFPPALVGATLVVAAVAGAVLLSRSVWPGTARALALQGSPTVLFLALSVCWATLVGVLGASTFSVWRDVNDHLLNRGLRPGGKDGVTLTAGLAWLGVIAALVFLVPLWLAWGLCGFVAGLGLLAARAVDRHEAIRILWRSGSETSPRVFHAGASIRWDALTMALLLPALTVPATGGGWSGRLASTMPITVGLGHAAMWAGAIAFLSYTLHGAVRMLLLARHDPAEREPVPVIIEKGAPLSDAVASPLATHGFRPVLGEDSKATGTRPQTIGPAVRVAVEAGEPTGIVRRLDRVAEFLALAPRVQVSPEGLVSLNCLAELRRLDNALLRDRLLEGLRSLLGAASRRRFARGTGFWLAPHLWYVRGLTRDADDPDYHSIGPPYHKVIPGRARQHLHAVLAALHVDLIFVEDAVPIEAVAPTFERLFDVHDVLGPGPIEEHAFVGLREVRVILHDFTLGDPFRREGYLEPSYEEIGRARILHIMRDRGGGGDEPDPTPAAPDERPRMMNAPG